MELRHENCHVAQTSLAPVQAEANFMSVHNADNKATDGVGKVEVSIPETAIELSDVNKWYGSFHVLRNIQLNVMRGERIVVCGPSGSGKSTMIRCINRLEEHQTGRIVVDGIELTNDLKRVHEVRREVGMVFQHFNLFPHLSVLENCTLARMWVRKINKKDATELSKLTAGLLHRGVLESPISPQNSSGHEHACGFRGMGAWSDLVDLNRVRSPSSKATSMAFAGSTL